MKYVIGIGGNEGNVVETFRKTLKMIDGEFGVITAISKWYFSKPLPVEGEGEPQPEYLNAVFILESDLDPESLLENLLNTEKKLGRDRSKSYYWGPRTVDLDIIAAEDMMYSSEKLVIPHPRMSERDFVLVPFLEIQKDWIHPEKKQDIESLLSVLPEAERYIYRECLLEQSGSERQ